uniref:WD repeat domain phosphoinositide-interacting protein 3 n=1 Tax=Mesocestoides corti TaxID=53468 RepID=A0A5K3F010_MESCO
MVCFLNKCLVSAGCFAIGMQNGFRIFNTDPLKQLEKCEFSVRDGTGIGFIEMLFRTSFLGLLGGGHRSRIPGNTACLWDGVEQKFVLELGYSSDVRAIRLRRDQIVVVLSNAVKVYTFGASPELVYQSETSSNPFGLCHVCQHADYPLIAFPGRRVGSVTLATTRSPGDQENVTNTPPPRQILAHNNPLVAITMNSDGELLATASQRGTLIRVFSTRGCELLHELRRGSNSALITSICFDATASKVVVTSNHGTVHVFYIDSAAKANASSTSNVTSGKQRIGQDSTRQVAQHNKSGGLLPWYFSSTSSQIRFPLDTKSKAICAFSPSNPDTLVALAADGSYSKYNFTSNGVVTREQSVNILDIYDDESTS